LLSLVDHTRSSHGRPVPANVCHYRGAPKLMRHAGPGTRNHGTMPAVCPPSPSHSFHLVRQWGFHGHAESLETCSSYEGTWRVRLPCDILLAKSGNLRLYLSLDLFGERSTMPHQLSFSRALAVATLAILSCDGGIEDRVLTTLPIAVWPRRSVRCIDRALLRRGWNAPTALTSSQPATTDRHPRHTFLTTAPSACTHFVAT